MKTRILLLSLLVLIGLSTTFYFVLMGQANEVTEEQVKVLIDKIDKAKDIQSLNNCANELEELGSGALEPAKKLMSKIDIHSKVFVYKVFYHWGDTEFATERLMNILRNYSDSSRARILAANVLAEVGSSELETQLVSALEIEEDPKVRVAIAQCLYATCKETKKSLAELRKQLESNDSELRKEAVFALASSGRVALVEDELKKLAKLPNIDGKLAREYIRLERQRINLEEAMIPRDERPDTHDYAENEKPENEVAEPGDPDFSSRLFEELLLKIQKSYLYEEKTEELDLNMDAARKMLDMIDPYSAYIHDNEELENWKKTLDHKYPGIGIELGKRSGVIVVISAIEGSPAYKAGIRPMDIVYKIGDTDSFNMSLIEAEFALRGKENTPVEIEVRRVGWYVPRTFTIMRSTVELPKLRYKMLPANLGFIHIPYFTDTTDVEFRNALEKLHEQDAKGYVIDVRNCPGGNIEKAIECADMLLDKDALIAYTQGQNATLGAKTEFISKVDPVVNEPVYIMVNLGTSDAAEVFAGALSKNDRAKIYAERWVSADIRKEAIENFNKETDLKKKGATFGKAIKQRIIPMKSKEIKQSALNLTVAFYYLKGDERIHDIGLNADEIIWREALDGWVLNEYETPTFDKVMNEYIAEQVKASAKTMLNLAFADNKDLKAYPGAAMLVEKLNTKADAEHVRMRLREKLLAYLANDASIDFDNIADMQDDDLLHQVIIDLATEMKIKLSDNKELLRIFK